MARTAKVALSAEGVVAISVRPSAADCPTELYSLTTGTFTNTPIGGRSSLS